MKNQNRVLSLFLAVLMVASVFTVFPPIDSWAAAPSGSIAIPKVGFIGEKFVIEGTVTSNGSPIDIVNIAVYKDSTQAVGVWCFRKEGLNASSFNFKTKAKLFEWGDEIESVNPSSTNPPFDTGAYSSVYVEVIVKAKDGTTTKKTGTVQIINVSKSDLDFSSAGGDKTFKITASSNWTVTDDKTWISVSPSSGSSSKTITVSCSKNTSTSSREGTVTVTHSSSGETYTIDVYQDGKEPNPAEFSGDIDFPDTIKDGEDFVFGGEIEVKNSPISIVNIGFYSDSTMETGITYYRNENVNSYSFDFNDAIPSFEWGDTLATVNSNSTNPPFDTSKYDRAYFVVTVKAKDGESKTYTHWVTVEETVISGSVNTTTDLRLGETFSFSGTVRSEGSPISVINIGMYADSTMNVGITYYRNENINSNAFDFSYVDTFVWGASLKTVNSNSANPPFETAKYSQVYFLITVKTADGEFVQYEKWVNATNHQLIGDINGDGEITNKDRFLLNRYLANMAGYTNINKTVADINGDGSVTVVDIEYLTNHLAGIKGYESFPERVALCLHANCEVVYAGNTVFVNNTNKNDGKHSYYHVWSSVCKDCSEDLGEFQGNDDAIKGVVEKKSCSYNFEGYCVCGAFDTSKYNSWSGYNATGKSVTVYETPYSSDWYGSIFEDEQVTVLGMIGDMYFIKYIVTATKNDKYGYVSADTIKSSDATKDKYSIEFDFETITLPVSGRRVLLIPKDGSGFFYVYKNGNRIPNISTLNNFQLDFSKNNVECKATTLVGGKQGGYGTLTVSFEDADGNIIYISSPSSYIVAESTSVYSSKDKSVFSESEKEYISLALDMVFSCGNIERPRDADFTYGDNVLLNIENIWDIVASLARLKNPTTEQCSAVIATYLEAYNDGTIGKYNDTSFLASLSSILNSIWTVGTEFPYEDFSDAFSGAIKTIQSYKGKPFTITAAKDIMKSLKVILLNSDDLFDVFPDLAKDLAKNGFSVKEFSKTLETMSGSEKFFSFMETVSFVGDSVEIGTDIFSAGCILFGSYDRQLSLLETIREVLLKSGYTENDVQIKAIDDLIDRYEEEFSSKLAESAESLWGDIVSKTVEIALGNGCPAFGILLTVAQTAAGSTTVAEEAEYMMFRLISHAYICTLNFPYEMFSTGEMTCSLDEAETMIKLYITMAIHENVLAIAASGENGEFTNDEKARFKNNITHMKTVYALYLS